MSVFKKIISTTHVDSQNDMITKEALEDIVLQSQQKYICVTVGHDPRLIPMGRVIGAKLVSLADGHYGVEATLEFFGSIAPVPDDENKDLKISFLDDYKNLIIQYDYSYKKKEILKKIEELNKKIKHNAPLREVLKKSIYPFSILTISGVFILGKIFEGFLHKTGEETFNLLKKELKKILDLQDSKSEKILQFNLTVKKDEKLYSVNLYLTNPSEQDIEIVLKKGLKKLDVEIGNYLTPGIRKVNINCIDNKLEVIYMLDEKAKVHIPSRERKIIDILI